MRNQPDRPADAGLSGFFSARFARVALMWHLSPTTPAIPHLSKLAFSAPSSFSGSEAPFPQLCKRGATSFLV
ncbi:hypothetical protein Y032_0338g2925 [Ancylostoma ceylanicum]|uniref:Uncharacterized protein n=1 Tax=Ancylostoma ceylanicum TaxID=53326 RepID=A0A016RY95_9BILA|nr:hypothetical protein Y032_0338g2925 [Ancylostoma ceylanicum]